MAIHIPTIRIPEIKTPKVNIDPAPFAAVHAQAAATVATGNKIALVSQLIPLKTKTIHTPLTNAERQKATEVARELAAHGWLTEADATWCQEQGIPVL